LLDGPLEAHETEVVWKQGHVVKVMPYKQVWIDQEDAQVRQRSFSEAATERCAEVQNLVVHYLFATHMLQPLHLFHLL
jgi:hypothetical protein